MYYPLPDGSYGYGIRDFVTIFLCSLIITSIRLVLSLTLSRTIPKHINICPSTLKKFIENSFYALYYIFAVLLELILLSRHKWFWFTSWPESVISMNLTYCSYETKLVYMIQMGFYLQGFFALFHESTKSKNDFSMMIIHHASTSLLLLTSYFGSRAVDYGTLVLFLHDVSDILLFVSKALNYLDLNYYANKGFSAFAILFFVCRLVLFPWLIGTLYRGSKYLDCRYPRLNVTFWGFPLFFLQLLHVKWFTMILRMVFEKLSHGKLTGDIRSPPREVEKSHVI
ncbi:hypothetical protein GEMRC1_006335 [Eukaryota sp. GEM-RC1]